MNNLTNREMPLRTIGIFSIILLFVVSFTWLLARNYYDNNEATDRTFLRLDSSLNNSNRFLWEINSILTTNMTEKLKDPGTMEKALIWKPKSDSALLFTNQIYGLIENTKLELQENSNNSNHKKFNDLYDSLNAFATNLIGLIPLEKRLQLNLLPVQKLLLSGKEDIKSSFIYNYFGEISLSAKLAILSKMELDVLRSSNLILEFINSQSSCLILGCITKYLPFAIQNTTCLLPGQTLEITAGIGSFNESINPTVIIDNK